MADIDSGLPVRTQADGTDERLHAKIVDGTTPSQRMIVDADLNAHVEAHGNNPSGGDTVIRTSELGALTPDGVYDVTNNTLPGNVGMIVSSRSATPGPTTQTMRVTGVQGSSPNTVWAQDISLHDQSGNPYNEANPLAVFVAEDPGTKVNDYVTVSANAAATQNHDYTVTALKTLQLTQVESSSSGKAKMEIMIETGVATGIFTSKFVQFNSTANANMSIKLAEPIAVAAGVRVRVAMTNRDNQAESVYSTISGHEI